LAHGTVEIKQQCAGAGRQFVKLGKGVGQRGHCGYSRVIVDHTESNHVRARPTNSEPFHFSASSPVKKWEQRGVEGPPSPRGLTAC
jgi:hypothetical protein